MADILSSFSTAVTLVKALSDLSDKLRDAEIKGLVADLSIELSTIKIELASTMLENAELKSKLTALQNLTGERCPRCSNPSWRLIESYPDPMMSDLGLTRRVYECSECRLREEKVVK